MDEAVTWQKGPGFESRVFTPIYTFPGIGFQMGVEKPGKEAFENPINENDMLPSVYQDGRRWEMAPSFFELYYQLQLVSREARGQPLELIGALLYRSSYMLDHVSTENGVWRWQPPADVMQDIIKDVPNIGGLPPDVFLTLVEVVALQEDTKYWTLGYKIEKGAGRTNNLQTCAHIIAAFLGRVNIVRFAGALARPPAGVAPISQKAAPDLFPLLKTVT